VASKTGKILVEVTDRGTITLPKSLRGASLYEVRKREGGGLELIPQQTIDAAQPGFGRSVGSKWNVKRAPIFVPVACENLTLPTTS
jgi:hypothetical protein